MGRGEPRAALQGFTLAETSGRRQLPGNVGEPRSPSFKVPFREGSSRA
jgi:hypothetical protein